MKASLNDYFSLNYTPLYIFFSVLPLNVISVKNIIPRGPDSVWIRSEMNQDVFGNPTDTSGALALLTYSNMYDSFITKSDPVTGSTAGYNVR